MATADVTMPPFTPDFRLLDLLWWQREDVWQQKREDKGEVGLSLGDISRPNISTRQENHEDTEGSMGDLRNPSGRPGWGAMSHTGTPGVPMRRVQGEGKTAGTQLPGGSALHWSLCLLRVARVSGIFLQWF